MADDAQIVFISCGQWSDEEKFLGRTVCNLVKTLTPFEPYFAENQSTFDGLSHNILGALNRCVGFIGIIHQRGIVSTPNGNINRASVWIEQEIAIAAFIMAVLGRALNVRLYVQEGVAREGIRDKLLLNPVIFRPDDSRDIQFGGTESEIINDLKRELPKWNATSQTKLENLCLEAELKYRLTTESSKRHDYELQVILKNSGTRKPDDWRVDVCFPRAFITPKTDFAPEIQAAATATHRVFRLAHRNFPKDDLYPGDKLTVMTIPYFVDTQLYWDYFELGNNRNTTITATVCSGDMKPREIQKNLRELQKF